MAKDFTTPDPALAPGSAHAGFTCIAALPVPEISGIAYQLVHDKSGARALWLACADTNRSFAIAFKTPPADDTGVFHILEHSVLCGSERYPVKEPFVHLLKSSMQTFLNAMTFPDKTMYPVASTNVADLENLMGVYLDAVLAPNIYTRPRIFEQEGWHYELESADAPLTYNGVVFNEMKGALSDPDDVLSNCVMRALFPDTAYGFESGGNPRAIPQLTYESFLDNHARHYNLANSYTIFYGDLDIDRELAFVAERFDASEHRSDEPANPLELQAPVDAGLVRHEMATAPENASVGVAYVLGTAHDRERVLAFDVLLDALAGSNEAPLKRRVLDAGLGDDMIVQMIDGVLQPYVQFTLKGAHEGAAERFRALIEETCAELADGGIPRDRLEASLAQAEFHLREGDFGSYADGVVYSIFALSGWLYDDDRPTDYLRYEDALAHMKAGLEAGYFEKLLADAILKSTHRALIDLVPVEEGDIQEELAELEAAKAAMTPAELDRIIDEVAELRAEQDAPDTPEDLAKLPMLSISDIDDPAPEPAPFDADAPLPCIAHELDTHGIAYLYCYFDLRCVAFNELPHVQILTELLGRLDTELLNAAALDTVLAERLGTLNFFCETRGRDEDPLFVLPQLVVGASALSSRIADLAKLPAEVWSTTLFADGERAKAILTQQRIALEQGYLNSGHSAAIARATCGFSRVGLASSQTSGLEYYFFIKDLLQNWDERWPALADKLDALRQRIFRAGNVTVSFTGSAEDRAAFWAEAGTLGLSEGAAEHILETPAPAPADEAFVTPANVVFVAAVAPESAADAGDAGTWSVLSRILSLGYLWNEVRVKGGAYGTGFRYTTTKLRQFYSYRDPGVDPTLARYDAAGEWLASWEPAADEFDGYVISTVAAHDVPVKPRALARRQDGLRFSGRDLAWRDMVRAQQLATTPEAVRALAPALSALADERVVCVFGSRDLIEASAAKLKVTELMGEQG